MSRTTADRQCGKCNWNGHIPEDVPLICPVCRNNMIAQPIKVEWPPRGTANGTNDKSVKTEGGLPIRRN